MGKPSAAASAAASAAEADGEGGVVAPTILAAFDAVAQQVGLGDGARAEGRKVIKVESMGFGGWMGMWVYV